MPKTRKTPVFKLKALILDVLLKACFYSQSLVQRIGSKGCALLCKAVCGIGCAVGDERGEGWAEPSRMKVLPAVSLV
jgi:hypothetical protein